MSPDIGSEEGIELTHVRKRFYGILSNFSWCLNGILSRLD